MGMLFGLNPGKSEPDALTFTVLTRFAGGGYEFALTAKPNRLDTVEFSINIAGILL
jgi:hypothetical protein